MRLIAEKNPVSWESIRVYQSQRARHGLVEVSDLIGYSQLKQKLREQMAVNAGVMIREHFKNSTYGSHFGELDSNLTMKQKKEKENLVNVTMRACKSTNETDVAEALQIRDILTPNGTDWSAQWIPWPDRIQGNGLACYVRLLWKLQSTVEKKMAEVRNEKGVWALSLFPVSTTYTRAPWRIAVTEVIQ